MSLDPALPVIDFVALRGTAAPLVMTVENPDGSPFDLSALGTLTMFLNEQSDFQGTAIFGAGGKLGVKSGAPTQNILTITPSAGDFDIASGDKYHLIVEDAAGTPLPFARGRVTIQPSPWGS